MVLKSAWAGAIRSVAITPWPDQGGFLPQTKERPDPYIYIYSHYLQELDVLPVLMSYTSSFYTTTSKTLFLRMYQMDPPPKRRSPGSAVTTRTRRRSLSGPESDAIWLWLAHNKLNIQLYDNEIEFQVYSASPLEKTVHNATSAAAADMSANLCKGNMFPKPSVCPLCYRDPKANDKFKSARTILRYLYGVYTSEKII